MVQVRRHNSLQHDTEANQCEVSQVVTPFNESRRSVSIILVGANPLYQKALKLILNDRSQSKREIALFVHSCSTVEDFEADVNRLPEPQRRSAIVLLLDEGGEPASTIKNIESLKNVNQSSRIIVVSNSKNADYINRCIEKGIHAYVLSDLSEDLLIDSVCLVAHDQMVFPSQIQRQRFDAVSQLSHAHSTAIGRAPISETGETEAEILGCLASGMSNKEISRLTGLSDPTTKLAIRKILSKIGAKNRVQAAVWAQKNGYSLDA